MSAEPCLQVSLGFRNESPWESLQKSSYSSSTPIAVRTDSELWLWYFATPNPQGMYTLDTESERETEPASKLLSSKKYGKLIIINKKAQIFYFIYWDWWCRTSRACKEGFRNAVLKEGFVWRGRWNSLP